MQSGPLPLGPHLPPAAHAARRGSRPAPRSSRWRAPQARGQRERSPGGLCAPSRHGPGRCAPFGVGPELAPQPQDPSLGPPRGSPHRACCTPRTPRPAADPLPACGPLGPTSQSRPSRPPEYLQDLGPARRSTAATSTSPRRGNARRGGALLSHPGPAGASPLSLSRSLFQKFLPLSPLHGSF